MLIIRYFLVIVVVALIKQSRVKTRVRKTTYLNFVVFFLRFCIKTKC